MPGANIFRGKGHEFDDRPVGFFAAPCPSLQPRRIARVPGPRDATTGLLRREGTCERRGWANRTDSTSFWSIQAVDAARCRKRGRAVVHARRRIYRRGLQTDLRRRSGSRPLTPNWLTQAALSRHWALLLIAAPRPVRPDIRCEREIELPSNSRKTGQTCRPRGRSEWLVRGRQEKRSTQVTTGLLLL